MPAVMVIAGVMPIEGIRPVRHGATRHRRLWGSPTGRPAPAAQQSRARQHLAQLETAIDQFSQRHLRRLVLTGPKRAPELTRVSRPAGPAAPPPGRACPTARRHDWMSPARNLPSRAAAARTSLPRHCAFQSGATTGTAPLAPTAEALQAAGHRPRRRIQDQRQLGGPGRSTAAPLRRSGAPDQRSRRSRSRGKAADQTVPRPQRRRRQVTAGHRPPKNTTTARFPRVTSSRGSARH